MGRNLRATYYICSFFEHVLIFVVNYIDPMHFYTKILSQLLINRSIDSSVIYRNFLTAWVICFSVFFRVEVGL